MDQHLIQRLYVLFDVTARFIYLRYQIHLILLYVDDLVHVLLVALYQVFLLAEDHSDQLVVVLVHLLQICSVVVLHFGVVGHRG